MKNNLISILITNYNKDKFLTKCLYSIKNQKLIALVESEDPQMPRQKLPKYYIRSGDVYAAWTETIYKYNNFVGKISLPIIVESSETINIDNYRDYLLAKLEIEMALKKC